MTNSKKEKRKKGAGSICGGVISNSKFVKEMKKYGIWVDMMAYILPDKQYDKWVSYKKLGKDKQADKIFERYSYSQIG